MKLFKNKLARRLAISKTIGLVIGVVAFIVMPYVFTEVDMMTRIGVLLWYTTFGAMIGIAGILDKHPAFGFKIPACLRGIIMGAWLNFVLVFFVYNTLETLFSSTFLSGYSPFLIVIEGAIIGLIIDLISTKYSGQGKELVN